MTMTWALTAEDRLEIMELYARYAWGIDLADEEMAMSVFADDGWFDHLWQGKVQGHDAIRANLTGVFPNGYILTDDSAPGYSNYRHMVESASQAYFGMELDKLSLPQMAYIAILPKGPANYSPERYEARALERRNWVLGQMLANGFIDEAAHAECDRALNPPKQTENWRQQRLDVAAPATPVSAAAA